MPTPNFIKIDWAQIDMEVRTTSLYFNDKYSFIIHVLLKLLALKYLTTIIYKCQMSLMKIPDSIENILKNTKFLPDTCDIGTFYGKVT